MKIACQMMRTLVPGLAQETDKATVMEHAVNFLVHLRQCPHNKCDDYVVIKPDPDAPSSRATLMRRGRKRRSSSPASSTTILDDSQDSSLMMTKDGLFDSTEDPMDSITVCEVVEMNCQEQDITIDVVSHDDDEKESEETAARESKAGTTDETVVAKDEEENPREDDGDETDNEDFEEEDEEIEVDVTDDDD